MDKFVSAPKNLLYSNGTRAEYGLDAWGRLAHLVNRASGGAAMSQFHYTYNAVGNITRIGLSDMNDGAWEYEYDVQNRLTKETRIALSGDPQWHRAYAYDPAGNRERLEWWDGSVTRASTYTHNALNQLVALTGSAQVSRSSVGYDFNGNLTGYLDGDGNSWGYGWTI